MDARPQTSEPPQPWWPVIALVLSAVCFATSATLEYRSIRWYRWAAYEYGKWWLHTPGESMASYNAWVRRRQGWERSRMAIRMAAAGTVPLIIGAAGASRYERGRYSGTLLAVLLLAAIVYLTLACRWLGSPVPRPYWDG